VNRHAGDTRGRRLPPVDSMHVHRYPVDRRIVVPNMPQVRFTQNIQRHVVCPQREAAGSTVREVLDAYFDATPSARGYVLDDQRSLRRHMVVFINGSQIHDRAALSDPVAPDATIDVMQALSGG
jgi:sulfur-carrier protein